MIMVCMLATVGESSSSSNRALARSPKKSAKERGNVMNVAWKRLSKAAPIEQLPKVVVSWLV